MKSGYTDTEEVSQQAIAVQIIKLILGLATLEAVPHIAVG